MNIYDGQETINRAARRFWMPIWRWVTVGVVTILLTLLLGRGCQLTTIGAPTLRVPAAPVTPGAVVLRGEVDPAARAVAVTLNGSAIGEAPVAADGSWMLTTAPLAAGDYTARATALDARGRLLATSADVAFSVLADATAGAPTLVIAEAIDPAALRLAGSGVPGTAVRVERDGRVVGTAPVGDDGQWVLTTAADAYANSFEAVGIAADGREIGRSAAVRLVTPALAAPLLATAAPQLADAALTDDGLTRAALRWQGTGEPATNISVQAGARDLGRVPVASDGTWRFDGEVALAAGDYSLTAQMVDAQNNLLGETTGTLSVPDLRAALTPVTPTIEPPMDEVTPGRLLLRGRGTPNSSVALRNNGVAVGTTTVGPDGNWALAIDVEAYANRFEAFGTLADGRDLGSSGETLVLVPQAARALSVDGAPAVGAFARADADGTQTQATLRWGGSGEPGNRVAIVTADDTTLATAPIEADGNWRVDATVSLPPGAYALRARQIGLDGAPLDSSAPADVAIPARSGPTVDALIVGGLASDPRTFVGTAQPGAEVELLIDDAVVAVVTADDGGNWRFTTDEATGSYAVRARSVADSTAVSEPLTVTLDSGAAISLTLGAVEDEDLNDDDADATSAPDTLAYSVSGRAAPDSAVQIVVDGVVVDTVTADDAGNWRYTGRAAPGSYRIGARSAQAGALPLATLPRLVTLPVAQAAATDAESDGDADGALAVQRIAPAADRAVALAGRAAPGASVQVVIEDARGRAVQATVVTADADGLWETSATLEAGVYTAAVRAVDAQGVPLLASNARPFVVGGATTGNLVAGSERGLLRVVYTAPAGEAAVGGSAATDAGAGDGADPAAPTFAVQAPALALIVDASWSMTLDLSGNTRVTANDPASRIAQAKAALNALLDVIPAATPVAVRAFGNIEGNLSCRTDLMLPLTPFAPAIVGGIVDGIVPQNRANTAIAASLDAVAADLADVDGPRVAVLLTDGEETCGGDPLASVQRLVDAGIDLQLNIVGFALADEALKAQFAEMAALTGGEFFDAADTATLSDALARAVGVPYRVVAADGAVVATGVVGGAPLLLPPGSYSVTLTVDDLTIEQSVRVRAGRLTTVVPQAQ